MAKAHSCHHSARDIQERRPVQSRFQSQPGQAKEADSRPDPLSQKNEKEHWSTSRSATPPPHSQAHPFYRSPHPPSIQCQTLWKSGASAPRRRDPKSRALAPATDPRPQTPAESTPPPPASPPHKPSPENPPADKPAPPAPRPTPSHPPETTASPTQPRPQSAAVPQRSSSS